MMESNIKKSAGRTLAVLACSSIACGGTAVYAAASNQPIDVYALDDTVVTAERIPSKCKETPADVQVITAKEIDDNHYHSVPEALRHLNGVTVSAYCMGTEKMVRLNGDDRVVVMLDGERLNNDQGNSNRASTDLNMIPSMKNIRRIEVIKGGGSALYGSDAVGGVINIITQKGEQAATTLDMNMGSWNTYDYELTNQGTQGDTSWFLVGNIQKQGHFDYKANGSSYRMPGSEYDDNGLAMRIDQAMGDSESLRLSFNHRSVATGTHTVPWGNVSKPYSFVTDAYNGKQHEIFNNASLTYDFKKKTDVPGFLRYFNDYKAMQFGTKSMTRLSGVDYQNGWQLDACNKLIAGLEWHQSDSSNAACGYAGQGLLNRAAYLQDTIKIGDKWTFVPGIRFDNHSMFGSHWSPKAALNYQSDKRTQLYASWGRVFKAPTANDLFWNDSYEKGNPNLAPESGYTESIGLNHDFDSRTSMSLSLFNSRLHDAIEWGEDKADGKWTPYNAASEKKHGIELSFHKQADKAWNYEIGYTYTHTEIEGRPNDYLNNYGQPNGFRLGIHYIKGPWKANLFGTMASGLNDACYESSRYAVFDFNASYDFNKALTMYFKADNFTDQAYSNYSGAKYPAPGRFFQLGVTCRF
jgi:vitamin B12 transporter